MIPPSLRADLERPDFTAAEAINLLDRASRYWINGDRKVAQDVEIVVRLLDRSLALENALPGAKAILQSLARESGLFPYVQDTARYDIALATEMHRIPGLSSKFFHEEQRRVFAKLMSGKNVILSAPTSFGKTLLVDALIAAKQPNLVMIVVPTLALLEERRRSLKERFPDYHLITQNFEGVAEGRSIVLGTQERILERPEFLRPDLFVVDEFYKLDLTKGDARAKSLNRLLAKYIERARQTYLLGPSIQTSPVNQEERPNFEFIRTEYSPVTADIVPVQPQGASPDTLAEVLRTSAKGASLIYSRSPRSARTIAKELFVRGISRKSPLTHVIAEWMRENYHKNWYLADAIQNGFGIHHGRLPRSIAHLMVELFNRRHIETLICTSSLIEGVNTVAKNVLIYDKYISKKLLDRFTFDNIKGRAGRMFQHFVGKVFLFNEPPEPIYEELDIPLLQDKRKISDESLVQIDDDDLSAPNRKRKQDIFDRLETPREILERYAEFGLESIEDLYQELQELISSGDRSLLWSGFGGYKTISASMGVVWGRLDFEKNNVRSANQFALMATRLRQAKSMSEFLTIVTGSKDLDDGLDLAFSFMRGAEYSFPKPLALLNELVNIIAPDEPCNYSNFIATMTSWGLEGNLKALEELGVPFPIIKKLDGLIDAYDTRTALGQIRRMMDEEKHLSTGDIQVLRLTLGEA